MNLKQENGRVLFPELFPVLIDGKWTNVYDNRYNLVEIELWMDQDLKDVG